MQFMGVRVCLAPLRCARSSGICMPNSNSLAFIVSGISPFIRTDRQTYMARSTQLWNRKRLYLPVTYFPTNLLYPFTLRVTGININSCDSYMIQLSDFFKKFYAIPQSKREYLFIFLIAKYGKLTFGYKLNTLQYN